MWKRQGAVMYFKAPDILAEEKYQRLKLDTVNRYKEIVKKTRSHAEATRLALSTSTYKRHTTTGSNNHRASGMTYPPRQKDVERRMAHPQPQMRRVNTIPRTDQYKAAYDQQLRDIGGRKGKGQMTVSYHSDGGSDSWYVGPRAKVGSWDNYYDGAPLPSSVAVFNQKLNWQRAAAKVGSLENYTHEPGGGKGRIFEQPTNWRAAAKVGSLENSGHIPGGGEVQVESRRLKWSTKAKVGSLDNIGHVPVSNVIPLKDKLQPVNWKAKAKVGSLDNAKHDPGGGNGQIFTQKLQWTNQARTENRNEEFERKQQERKEEAMEMGRKRGAPPLQLAPGSKYHNVLPPIRRKLAGKSNVVWTRGPDQEEFNVSES